MSSELITFVTLHYNTTMDIRDNIKSQAKLHNITLDEVAKKLGINPVTLYRNIAGNWTKKTLENIAGAIGCEVSDFFSNEDGVSITCPHCGKTIRLKIDEDA